MSFRLLCCTIDRESNKGSNMYTFYNDQPGISTLEWRIQQILTYRSRTNKIEFQDDSQIPLLHNSHWKQENVNLSIWRQHCNLTRQFQTHDHGFFEFVLLQQNYLLSKYWVSVWEIIQQIQHVFTLPSEQVHFLQQRQQLMQLDLKFIFKSKK